MDGKSPQLTTGSVCSGYLGLELGVADLLSLELSWVADNDPAASAVLACHTEAPNLGDITQLKSFPDVNVLTAGLPCQPVSVAGAKKGPEDVRWLWTEFARLIGSMDSPPGLLLLENPRALLTHGGGRTFGDILRSLAQLGFVGKWRCLDAASVGAAHERERVFIAAAHADSLGSVASWLVPCAHRAREQQGTQHRTRGRASRAGVPARAVGLWQDYDPVIRRWERAIGRAVPEPPMTFEKTSQRQIVPKLSVRFTEWLMGLPDGWVDDVPGLSWEDKLTLLGNGVVPQQARAAFLSLLGTDLFSR